MSEPLNAALQEWAKWVYTQAEQAKKAEPKDSRAWDGKPTVILDYCGILERRLIEATMASGVWKPK